MKATSTTDNINPMSKVTHPPLDYKRTPEQIQAQCSVMLKRAQIAMDRLAVSPQRSFHRTFLVFEYWMAQLEDTINPIYLLKSAHPQKAIRKACQQCLKKFFAFQSKLFSRRDLYQTLQRAATQLKKTPGIFTQADRRLVRKHLSTFMRNGAARSAEKAKQAAEIQNQISKISMKFMSNLGEDRTVVRFTRKELEGLSPDLIATMPRDKQGRYLMAMRVTSHYIALMRNGTDPRAREKAMRARFDLQGASNIPLLEKMLKLRQKFAKLMGYPTYAHYVLEDRMAQKPSYVFSFLKELQTKLQQKMKRELKILLKLKRKQFPRARRIEA
ncbi:MAG: M3 family metallopeptidase, partial [Myxococcota bacterium]